MLVYIVAVLESVFYLLSVPVHLSLTLDGWRVGAGAAAFDPVAALRRARRGLAPAGGAGRDGPGFGRVWPVLRHLRFDSLELTGWVSLGDAAATAIACGGLNGLARCLRGRAGRLRVEVRPEFAEQPRLELRGMACARTGQIMLAIIQNRKGRIHPWKSTRLKAS